MHHVDDRIKLLLLLFTKFDTPPYKNLAWEEDKPKIFSKFGSCA